MSDIIKPGNGILFMKVGTHAKETLADIIERKTKEIHDAGYAMWGYGGNTCHPRTMVQPFAAAFANNCAPIYLCMQEMESHHFAEPLRANEFSTDGSDWKPIPRGINVLGSRFALVVEELHREAMTLPMERARVAIGLSKGRAASRYIQGQVDKACLEILDSKVEPSDDSTQNEIPISLVAKLKEPYAVFLRDHR